MGVHLRIGVGVVHTVEQCVSPWRKERRALADVGEQEEKLLPEFVHREHLVSCVPVQIERLREERQVVVRYEEKEYRHGPKRLNQSQKRLRSSRAKARKSCISSVAVLQNYSHSHTECNLPD